MTTIIPPTQIIGSSLRAPKTSVNVGTRLFTPQVISSIPSINIDTIPDKIREKYHDYINKQILPKI